MNELIDRFISEYKEIITNVKNMKGYSLAFKRETARKAGESLVNVYEEEAFNNYSYNDFSVFQKKLNRAKLLTEVMAW